MDSNIVIITGRLTRDVDYRSTATGTAVAEFGIASGNGDNVYFGAVTAWNSTADYLRRNARKGTWVLVSGRLTRDEWRSRGGEKQSKTRIVANTVEILRQPGDGGPSE